jgi:hypothetical protein
MSIRKRFNENFGIQDNLEEERKRFVSRVNQVVFQMIDTRELVKFEYNNVLFDRLCYKMGIDASEIRHRYTRRHDHHLLPMEEWAPEIRNLTQDDFQKTCLVLCILYTAFKESSNERMWLSTVINAILSEATCDLGVRWHEDFFYLSGAKELDESLVEDVLTWLKDYSDERQDYTRALQCQEQGALSDVVQNCYKAVEGVARAILGNQKILDNNKDELLKKIGLSDGWRAILASFIKYAHDYRHASDQRHDITKPEAEAYLYMTGLFIRLLVTTRHP